MTLLSLLCVPKDLIAGTLAIFSRSDIRRCAWAPVKIGIVSFFLSVILFYLFRNNVAEVLAQTSSQVLHALLVWGLFIINILISGVIAIVSAIIGGAFYFDTLSMLLLKRRKIIETEIQRSFRAELGRVATYTAVRLLIGGVWGTLFLLSLFVPIVSVPVLLLGFLLMGIDVLSSPLAAMADGSRIFSVAWRHLIDTVLIGVLFSGTLLIPFGGLLLLPALYGYSVERMARWPEMRARTL